MLKKLLRTILSNIFRLYLEASKAFILLFSLAKKYYYFPNVRSLSLSYKSEIKHHENIELGENCIIGECTIGAQSKIVIGKNVTISKGAVIETAYLTRDSNSRHSSKPIIIEDNVWICSNAIILAGAVLRRNSIIGAGSVVKGEVKENEVFKI